MSPSYKNNLIAIPNKTKNKTNLKAFFINPITIPIPNRPNAIIINILSILYTYLCYFGKTDIRKFSYIRCMIISFYFLLFFLSLFLKFLLKLLDLQQDSLLFFLYLVQFFHLHMKTMHHSY